MVTAAQRACVCVCMRMHAHVHDVHVRVQCARTCLRVCSCCAARVAEATVAFTGSSGSPGRCATLAMDVLYASDQEDGRDDCDVLYASETEAAKRPRITVNLDEIVQRTCRCKASDCYTQFNCTVGLKAIRAARDEFQQLPSDMQDVYIALHVLGKDPFENGAGQSSDIAEHGVAAESGAALVACEWAELGGVLAATEDGSDDAGEVIMASELSASGDDSVMYASSECEPAQPPAAKARLRRYPKRRSSATKRRSCVVAEKPVCQHACARLLGIGTSRVERVRKGERSLRGTAQPKHPTLGFSLLQKHFLVWPSVVLFLWMTYHTCAEGLPDQLLHLHEVRDATGMVERLGKDPALGGNSELQKTVSKIALDLANYGTDPEMILKGPGFLSGARRYLQHDKPIHLFWEYVGWCKAHSCDKTASYSSFLRVFRKIFTGHLKFRKAKGSQHAECSTCVGLKAELRAASSFRAKTHIMERYTEHILLQWLDRQVWWALGLLSTSWFVKCSQIGRDAAFASVSLSVAAIIIDGMDQAKFRIPRPKHVRRMPKAMEVLHRPALHVVGAWLQGAALDLAVGDEDLCKDSNTQLETLARLLDGTLERFHTLPLGLHLQQDNCVREGKNTYVACFMVSLVALGVFKWCQLGFLRKGHTHENVDQAPRGDRQKRNLSKQKTTVRADHEAYRGMYQAQKSFLFAPLE